MTEDPPDFGNLEFSEVPTPDHTRSVDDPTDGPASAETPLGKAKRRILPGAGSRDAGTKDARRGPGRPPREPRERKPLPPIPRNGFAPDVERFYVMLGMGLMPFDVELSAKVVEIAEPAGEAWDELARKNEVVRRVLVSLLETGAWGKVFAAHAPLIGLAFARMTGESVRVTFAASQLGREAEDHANRPGGDDGSGRGPL
jgi:hypothetical protein